MKWISINDRLPLPGEMVLFFSLIAGMVTGYYSNKDGTNRFYDSDSYSLLKVTHWMPLPEPPYENTN